MRKSSCPSSSPSPAAMYFYVCDDLGISHSLRCDLILAATARSVVVQLTSVSISPSSARPSPAAKFQFSDLKRKTRCPRFYAKMGIPIYSTSTYTIEEPRERGYEEERDGRRAYKREREKEGSRRSRGPATTSCSHLARVMPATQWSLQVLPLQNPLLRSACACWPTLTPPQREAGTKQHEDSMHEESPVSQRTWHTISRTFRGYARIDDIPKSIRTSAATESLLTPVRGNESPMRILEVRN